MTAISPSLVLVVDNLQPQKQAYDLIESHFRENHKQLVQRYTRFLNSKERAEDVVQEGYLRAMSYWNKCPETAEDFARWFHRLISNALKDNHREEIMHGAVMYREENDNLIDSSGIPAVIYRQVVQRIEAKPSAQSTILKLFLLDQQRPSDIANMVPESVVAIRKCVSRFRKELKDEFGVTV